MLEEDSTSWDRDHPPEFGIDPGATPLLLKQECRKPAHRAWPVMGGTAQEKAAKLGRPGSPRDACLQGPCWGMVPSPCLLSPRVEVMDFHLLEGL